MRADPSVIIYGENVAVREGSSKTSENVLKEFGPLRLCDKPISEMEYTGAAVGAVVMGMERDIEIMFMNFFGVALDPLVTEAAEMRYLSNGTLSVAQEARASRGAGLGFGSRHSRTLVDWVL